MARNLDAIRAKHEALLAAQGGGKNNDFLENFLTVKDNDDTVVRILPGKEEEDPIYVETAIHRVPQDFSNPKGKRTNYHCARIQGDACPICDIYFDLYKTAYDEDKALAKLVKPGKRYYLNVYDRESKAVKIYSTGIKVFDKILSAILNTDDYGDFLSVTDGHDFKINHVQLNKNDWPNYDGSMPRPKSTPLGSKAEVDEIMDKLHDLNSLIKVKPYEDLKKAALEIRMHSSLDVNASSSDEAPESEEVSDEDFVKRLKA
jgi:hypothetical protein